MLAFGATLSELSVCDMRNFLLTIADKQRREDINYMIHER